MKLINMSIFVRNLLALALTLLGTLQIAGFALKNEPLFLFGQALALAPLPVPFRDHGGYENFASYRSYELIFEDGRVANIEGNRNLTQLLTGPHRRKIVYMQAVMLMPRLPDSVSSLVMRKLFCDEAGTFAARLGLSGEVRSVTVTTQVKTSGEENKKWESTFSCLL